MKSSSARRSKHPKTGLTGLKRLIQRQANEGVSRLHQDLKGQRDAGIIDGKGKRLRPGLPALAGTPFQSR